MQSESAGAAFINKLRLVDFDLVVQARTQYAVTPVRDATGHGNSNNNHHKPLNRPTSLRGS